MAGVKPFKAIRPREDLVKSVSTLPYDVYSEEEARRRASENENSFLRIVRPEVDFPLGTDPASNEVYEHAKALIDENLAKGVFVKDDVDCYYIYREIRNGRAQTGLVACFCVDDYLNGVIKRHEFTRQDKEDDRTRHIDICSAQTGLVFLAFQSKPEIRIILAQIAEGEPLCDFVSEDDVRQTVWKVSDPDMVETITTVFGELESLYIADGHHRSASAASVCQKRREAGFTGDEEFNYFLAVAFPHDELLIMPYYRVVRDLNGLSSEEFLDKLNDLFRIEEIAPDKLEMIKERDVCTTRRKGEIDMFLDGCWYTLDAREAILKDDAIGGLDVSLLQDNVLGPILGIEDPRKDARIDFVGGVRGYAELEKRCSEDMQVAFALYPTSMDEIIRVTDEGKVMPPKSTWFEPKLQSGLFIHRI